PAKTDKQTQKIIRWRNLPPRLVRALAGSLLLDDCFNVVCALLQPLHSHHDRIVDATRSSDEHIVAAGYPQYVRRVVHESDADTVVGAQHLDYKLGEVVSAQLSGILLHFRCNHIHSGGVAAHTGSSDAEGMASRSYTSRQECLELNRRGSDYSRFLQTVNQNS